MLALELDKTVVKSFMGQILREEIFDNFDVRSVDISAQVRINLDCASEEGFSSWATLRPLVYAIVKVSPKPKYVKIVFSCPAATVGDIHPNAAALFLNLIYENDSVNFTTATAQKEFALDKTLDSTWDERICKFFAKKNLLVVNRE